jgi:uncharacterized integral membrane protein (TIGR00698 family)
MTHGNMLEVTAASLIKVRPTPRAREAAAGAAVLAAVVLVARPLGAVVPFVGAPALALLLGAAARVRWSPGPGAQRILRFASRTVLQAAVVLLGATFGLGDVLRIGRTSVPLMLGTLAACLLAARLVGRALRVEPAMRTLVGVGTAICGASAIGAVSGIVAATEAEIAYAVSTIFVFNVVAVVLYPPLGHLLGLSQHAYGLWAGTAVNDTSSVVAAAYAYGHTAGNVAVVTKLARTTMIVPIALALGLQRARTRGSRSTRRLRQLVPPFLLLFVAAAALHSTGVVSPGSSRALAWTATLAITFSLGAIGLSTRFADLRSTGLRPLALGTVLWAVVGVTGLLLQHGV